MGIINKSQLFEYRNANRYINENLRYFSAESKVGKVSVFLSHKHDELKELDGAISFLKKQGVSVYVDWLDDEMRDSFFYKYLPYTITQITTIEHSTLSRWKDYESCGLTRAGHTPKITQGYMYLIPKSFP